MDTALLRALNGLRSPALDAVAGPASRYGYYLFPALMLVALALGRRRAAAAARDGVLTWFLGLFVAEDLLKPLVARPRPTADAALRGALRVLGRVPPPTSYSFPSGTATACFAGAAWIWLRWGPRAGAPAALAALLVSASRVYAGVHYPSDILAGALIGVAVALGVRAYSRWASAAPHA